MSILSSIGPHLKGDILLYLLFFAGQCLYILKRAAMAIRSKTNPIQGRRAFVEANWDIMLIRFVFEIPVYLIWRHYSLADIFSAVGVSSFAFLTIGDGPFSAVAIGFAADCIIDWASTWEKLPGFIRQFIKEQIPPLPSGNSGPIVTKDAGT